MTFENFDKRDIITKHVDNIICKLLSEGNNFDQVLVSLDTRLKNYSRSLEKSEKIDTRYKYVYTLVQVFKSRTDDIVSTTRVRDNGAFAHLTDRNILDLIKLKDKLNKICQN